ncbi:bis(5'-adenosyl)-triphosphatase enpp4-like [Octopus sinensis]|uniref:Bis(5'-adenosyl)-triphosphatase enpp4-like n=1 Tax=Octopus sinensis TaxID=2607531 RepID=A0A6P7TAX1_9MOLL|nr:bis(5'-adenosyl)-triphosphatase enpp4-like [Octopus sinensis]
MSLCIYSILYIIIPCLYCFPIILADQSFPNLLLVSFDGFRWDYMTHSNATLNNFKWFVENGVSARRGLQNAFITKTFPNHITLVTGMYEESHGIVGNTMYDPLYNETFYGSAEQVRDPKWMDDGGEPIWVTNQKENTKARSGCVYWVGDGASIKGFKPYRYLEFNKNYLLNFTSRIDKIIEWFTDPSYPINLGLLYFEEPDHTGHVFGPDSPEIDKKLTALNNDLGYLIRRLNNTGLLSKTNVIITSDHGMAFTPADKIINLDLYITPSKYQIFQKNPIGNILPNKDVPIEQFVKNLSSVPHLHVFLKEDIPESAHYKHNRRIQPLLLVPDEGYTLNSSHYSYHRQGEHGYNNTLLDMHPIFMASGPSLKKNFSVDMFENVDLYPLMCTLLGLKPSPNNGSMETVQAFLIPKYSSSFTTFITYMNRKKKLPQRCNL